MLKISAICDHNIKMMSKCPEAAESSCGILYRML